jgi:FAD/FMN-containing dehydrogenase
MTSSPVSQDFLDQLLAVAGQERVILDPEEQRRYLYDRNFTLYSALLADVFAERRADAIVRPATRAMLADIVHLAVRARVPLTARGAGLTTWGQSLPLAGGVLLDIRDLDRVLEVTPEAITVEPGVVLAAAEAAARARGRELRVLPSNYPVSTAAGFVAGGSAGLGSIRYGFLWDGNVSAAEILTAEDPPRLLTLTGSDANLVTHAYGTTGVITRLTFPLAPARDWSEACATFVSFDAAARFAYDLSKDSTFTLRLCALQQAPIPSFFQPVKDLFTSEQSAVLLMLEEGDIGRATDLARSFGGTFFRWPSRPSISQFAFNHSILWSRKRHPQASWVQLVFSEGRLFEQLSELSARFGEKMLQHVEFVRRPNGSISPFDRSVILDPDPEETRAIIAFCRELGVHVINPHSYVLEEIGMTSLAVDVERTRNLKARVDPWSLLNPGKFGGTFYESAVSKAR